MRFQKTAFIGLIIIAAVLTLKSIKQLIYLSFTLLTLKFVWVVLIFLFVLSSVKKRSQPSGKNK